MLSKHTRPLLSSPYTARHHLCGVQGHSGEGPFPAPGGQGHQVAAGPEHEAEREGGDRDKQSQANSVSDISLIAITD